MASLKDLLTIFTKQVSYRNLVFKGGGVRGIAYIGAMEVLEEQRILNKIQRVAGTSAGAITALLTSLRLSVEDIKGLFDTLDLSKIPQAAPNGKKPILDVKPFMRIVQDEAKISRLMKSYGWFSSEYFFDWLRELVAQHAYGNPQATFEDFHKLDYLDLHVVASNLTRQRAEIFSYRTSQKAPVAAAVRLSMSIPLYFEALQFDGKKFGSGDYYVDGGLYNNYPIHIFDQPPFFTNRGKDSVKVNPETLGLFLYPDENCEEKDVNQKPKNIWDFMSLLIGNFYTSKQTNNYQFDPVNQSRSIAIGDCCIDPTDFNIHKGDEKYKKLYLSGMTAAKNFLKNSERV